MKRSLIIFTLLYAGCSATETGNPNKDNGEAAGGGACDETSHDIELDEKTSLGFSANDIASVVAGNHSQTLEWLESELAGASFEGSTELQVRVELGDSARFVESKPKEGGQEGPALGGPGTECNDRVELDTTLFITSGDGALDEHIDAVFRAESTRLASARFQLPTDELGGQLEITLNPPQGFEPDGPPSLSFDIGIAEVGFTGSISVTATYQGNGGVAAGGGGPIARWPAGSQCDYGFPVAVDQSDAYRQVTEAFNTARPLQLSYEPETADSELTLQLGTSGDTVCEGLAGGPEAAREVHFAAELSLESGDGVIDGTFQVEVFAQIEQSGEVTGQASMSTISEDTTDWLETLGIHQSVDFSSYDHGQVALSAGIYAGELSGTLSVRGADVADCVINPPEPDPNGMGAPGCRGTDYFDLWVARFSE